MKDVIETSGPVPQSGSDQAAQKMLEETAAPQVGHVTGIGGVFFKSRGDQQALNDWYETNLGIKIDKKYGNGIIPWSAEDINKDGGITAWKNSNDTSKWFGPSNSEFMINYRVDNLEVIYERLKKNDPKSILGEPESYSYGKFLWVLDPDGNKVELWEPNKK